MLHDERVWGEPVEVTLDEFAEKVTGTTWTNCTAWKVGDFVFVNDAFGGDGAQEYAVLVCEDGQWFQVESWTCSWMDARSLREHFARLPNSEFHQPVSPIFEKHGYGTYRGPMSCCA
jgi:hypothetical protein